MTRWARKSRRRTATSRVGGRGGVKGTPANACSNDQVVPARGEGPTVLKVRKAAPHRKVRSGGPRTGLRGFSQDESGREGEDGWNVWRRPPEDDGKVDEGRTGPGRRRVRCQHAHGRQKGVAPSDVEDPWPDRIPSLEARQRRDGGRNVVDRDGWKRSKDEISEHPESLSGSGAERGDRPQQQWQRPTPVGTRSGLQLVPPGAVSGCPCQEWTPLQPCGKSVGQVQPLPA